MDLNRSLNLISSQKVTNFILYRGLFSAEKCGIERRLVTNFIMIPHKDRIKLHLPSSCPVKALLHTVTERLYRLPRPSPNSS
jgi:hypothetical protein